MTLYADVCHRSNTTFISTPHLHTPGQRQVWLSFQQLIELVPFIPWEVGHGVPECQPEKVQHARRAEKDKVFAAAHVGVFPGVLE